MKTSSPPKNNVHFIGIGGIGMSALARWYLTHQYSVSGSDREKSVITQELQKDGIRVFISHKANHIPHGTRLVIHTSAIPASNAELKRAHALRIPTKLYAEALGDLTKKYTTLTISGSHGKSTTTALLSLVLTLAGFDPTVIIGTKLKEFKNSNFRNGKSKYLILEADEHNAAFLNYSPSYAILTNIDREHLDFYKNISNAKNTFLKFIGNIRRGGVLVVNRDDKNLASLKNKIQSIASKNNLRVFWFGLRAHPRLYQRISASLQIPGEHNASNALAAYTLAKQLGVKEQIILKALKQYKGAWRRMEYRGDLALHIKHQASRKDGRLKAISYKLKASVYDDYAHHPTEIRTTLAGIAQKWPKSRVICVFEPHQAKRLALLFKEFVEAFWGADALILLPIYKVSGRDEMSHIIGSCNKNVFCRKTSNRFCNNNDMIVAKSISSQKLAEAIQKKLKAKSYKLKAVTYLPSPKKLREVIVEVIRNEPKNSLLKAKSYKPKAIVVMMGAGDIYRLTNSLIES